MMTNVSDPQGKLLMFRPSLPDTVEKRYHHIENISNFKATCFLDVAIVQLLTLGHKLLPILHFLPTQRLNLPRHDTETRRSKQLVPSTTAKMPVFRRLYRDSDRVYCQREIRLQLQVIDFVAQRCTTPFYLTKISDLIFWCHPYHFRWHY
jgi:hypothetical protein